MASSIHNLDHIFIAFSAAIFFIMLVIGMAQDLKVYRDIIKQPKSLYIGLLLQLVFLPSAAALIAAIVELPKNYAIGLILVALSPCGACCGAINLFMRTRLELSITLTTITSIMSPLTLAIGTYLYLGDTMPIPFFTIVKQLFFVASLPVILGALIRIQLPDFTERFFPILKRIGFLLLITLLSVVVIQHYGDMRDSAQTLLFPCLLLCILAFLIPRLVSKFTALSDPEGKTISVQVGMQNGTTALAVIISDPALYLASITIAFYSVSAFLIAFVLIPFWSEKPHGTLIKQIS